LATALSLILVGVPFFLVHWLWVQRASAREEEEKTATLRAVFLYGALFATLLPAVQNLLALINRTFIGVANMSYERALIGGAQSWPDNLIAIILNLLLAAYFWSILRAEWPALPDTENFKDIRRVYRYLWMLYGLLMIIFGAQQNLRFILYIPTDLIGSIGRETFVNATALLVVGTPIWFFAWRFIQDALPDPDENSSVLRLVILYLLALGGTVTVLTAGGNILYSLLSRLLGEDISTTDLIQNISGPLSILIPFGALWGYYGGWLNKQFAAEENIPRRSGMKRVYYYILSVIGLATTITGMLLLFTLIIDQLTSRPDVIAADFIMKQLAGAVAVIVVGLPLWLQTWRPMQAEALVEGEMGGHARRSVVRKAYLYLALFASVLGTMAPAAIIVFLLIQAALKGQVENDFLKSILTAVQALIVFAVVLVYHLSALRKDGAVQTEALEEKQSGFNVVVFDHNGKFGESVKTVFAKYAPKLPVTVLNANENITNVVKANAVVLPGSLAVNAPANVDAWIRSFSGSRLIVADEAAGVYWMNDLEQLAQSAQALAEGQEIRRQSATRSTPVWTYVAYVFAALFACQLVFILISLGISLVTNL
ncbi:MAG TPA: DUF5671 domain-containing protein, partial [Anaerolineales bacterium]|nr:DUF5671 domain-containing protein [Anaerolineales bacterium]